MKKNVKWFVPLVNDQIKIDFGQQITKFTSLHMDIRLSIYRLGSTNELSYEKNEFK